MTPARDYDLTSSRFFADPEATFARMRERAPVHYSAALSAWVLTTYADISEALRNPGLSADRNGAIGRGRGVEVAPSLREVNAVLSQWMPFSDPPRHTRLRSVVAQAFQPHALRSLVPFIDGVVDDLLGRALEQGEIEVVSELGVPLSERVTAHLLGLPEDAHEQLKVWTEDLFGFIGAGEASDDVVRANAAGINACRAFVAKIVEARRQAPRDDLITQLLRDTDGDFSEEELVGLIITLVAGAYETTAHAIGNGLWVLLQHPTELQRLRDEPELISRAVEETLRVEGPALSVQRRATRELTIRGRPIDARARIYCMLHSANHDAAAFEDPERVDIARHPCRHLGLGRGPHFCLGAWLTRLEIRSAILEVVQRFPNLRLASDSPPRWTGNFAIRGLERLPLIWEA